MTLKLHIPESRDLKPRLTVFGVGGAGGNAVNNMIARSLDGVDFVVANTDAQALTLNEAIHKLQLGEELTEGLGAGAKPEIGAAAAEESIERIVDLLKGSHMCFITAGMGGGTGTGAAPIIAQAARELGILTIGVVTKPFNFEGSRRMKQAEAGINELQKYVDTLITIPNQNLFAIANEKTTFTEAFALADDVLYQGVKGVTDLMVKPGIINLDFADVRSVMDEMGKAVMGTGEAEGEDRALVAAERALQNPLLDDVSLKGARGVLINITAGDDLTLMEIDEAANKIGEEVGPDANIIVGASRDNTMEGRIRVSVVATGIDAEERHANRPSSGSRRTEAVATTTVEAPREIDLFDVAPAAPSTARQTISEPVHAAPEFVEPVQAPIAEKIAEPTYEQVVEPQYYAEAPAPAPAQVTPAPIAPQVQVVEGNNQERVIERMQKAATAQPTAAPRVEGEAPRPMERIKGFGLENMIRRMSGTSEAAPVAKAPAETARPLQVHERTELRQQAAPTMQEPRLSDGERERVDIPAFLRRQAN